MGPIAVLLPVLAPVSMLMLWFISTLVPRAVVAGVVCGGTHVSVKLKVVACGMEMLTILSIRRLPL